MELIGPLVLLALISLVEGEVVNSFETCKQFFVRDQNNKPVPPTVLEGDQYKQICQKYKNNNPKDYRYATLYDTNNKIPVYSAYKFPRYVDSKNEDSTIEEHWKIEPQLDLDNGIAEMTTEGSHTHDGVWGKHQALNIDYREQKPTGKYQRGHLYPKCHNCNKNQSESTFTLTNAAPMTPEDNTDWYGQVEKVTANMIHNACEPGTAYVVTGVVPGDEKVVGEPPKKKTRTEVIVNVPSYIWSAACCKCRHDKTTYLSEGFLAATNTQRKKFPYPPEKGWKMLAKKMSVDDLNKKLSELYNNRFKVFGDVCGGNGTLKQKGRAEDVRNKNKK